MIRPTQHPPLAKVIALQTPAKPPQVETPEVLARHRGRCGAKLCRSPIRLGEEIQRVDGSWHHAECVPFGAVDAFAPPRERAA